MEIVKKHLYDILAVVMFAVISFVYFMPADIDGRILYRHDSSAGRGAGREATEYYEQTGERTRWSNSTFSGMPTYQTAPSYSSTDILTTVMNAYHLWLPDNVWFLFAYLLGFYILLRAFDFRELLSVLGAIVWAFSSYFLIIIAAGHLWKVMALAYLPPMIAGVVLTYRGKYLWGFIVTAIFAAFEVKANHVQMTYYYLFVIALMIIAFLVQAVREQQLARFIKATSVCIAAAAIGICINFSNLYHTWQYSQESMRGKSELVKQNATNQTNSGLDRDYITQWSYGIGETWTLLVPNVKGGASVPLSQNPKAMAQADQQYMQIYQQLGQYWGEQPGTSGPVYVGAFVLMLFVLGLFIVKGPMKWALLAATVLSILLSWGRNLMPFTDFFIDYVPMYSKFRTVSSILVIAEFTIPLLAMMALKKLIDHPEVLTRQVKYIYISYAFTGGMALLFALAPSLFFSDYVSSSEMEAMKSIPAEYLNPMLINLKQMREAIFTADCWRSFWIITLGTLCLLLFKARRLRAPWLISALIVLCLIDMWQVDKRYLNDDMFVERSVRDTPQPMTATDKQILQDKSLDYRVLNLASNTFNENETSYYHKSIGGYHAAKLRRYQELIEAYIMPEMQQMMPAIIKSQGDMTRVNGDSLYPVLNMLNTKYIILPLQEGQTAPLQNPYTYGNAWFVDRISYVNNANEELDALRKINLRHAAVADVKFKSQLGEAIQQDNVSMVKIKSYAPNRLSYDVTSDKGGILVFSEIYYPGWEATVDGQPAELGRVNYVLRAMHIQPGRHQVTLQFFPASIKKTETIAYISYAILILVILVGVFVDWKKRKQKL
ncbi:YfhO family protein [Hoylesella enoeca]|uniref:YfhO family protein n=1 Tax=Hoylesella enoeca TaxID=76123 RepID=UPI00288A0B8D|nr:YfhO family protein [Hoylesella enoeca]